MHVGPYLRTYVLFLELVELIVGKGFRMHNYRFVVFPDEVSSSFHVGQSSGVGVGARNRKASVWFLGHGCA